MIKNKEDNETLLFTKLINDFTNAYGIKNNLKNENISLSNKVMFSGNE